MNFMRVQLPLFAAGALFSSMIQIPVKNSRYFVLGGTQIVKGIASTPAANEFPPGWR
jgi:hypothetical protein